MKITKYIHSCLQIEKNSDKILFDPGKFSFAEGLVKPSQFRNLQAIVMTHYHPDHVDEEALKKILENNENAAVLGNSEIVGTLAEKDIEAEVFESGQRAVAGFVIEAYEAPHEPLLADELPQNTAYLIDGKILHPGDSLSRNLVGLKGTPVLCLPMMAPWSTELQVYEFAREMSPETIVPIHDGFAKNFFLESRYKTFEKYLSQNGINFRWMSGAGDSLEI